MFQVKIGCELKLAADDDDANLMLIWPHRHFQQKKVKVLLLPKKPGVEDLKMRYRYAIIEFVSGSSTCVTDMLSSNLFVV